MCDDGAVQFDFVNNRVACGDAINDAADVAALVAARINVVVSARDDFNDSDLLSSTPGIQQYLWNPTPDDGLPKPASYWQKTVEFVLPLLALPNFKVYIHCRQGIRRGPCNTLAVLMAQGLSEQIATNLIQASHPQAQLFYAPGVMTALQQLGYS